MNRVEQHTKILVSTFFALFLCVASTNAIAEIDTGLSVPATSSTGDYTVTWNAGGPNLELRESVGGGPFQWASWSTEGVKLFTGKADGTYTYRNRLRICPYGCYFLYSAEQSIVVSSGISTPAIISGPANDLDGDFVVQWLQSPGATAYTLQHRYNGGLWTTSQYDPTLSFEAAGESNGTHEYRVRACDASGCTSYTSSAKVLVGLVHYELRQGDYNADNLTDIAVIASDDTFRTIDDFILKNIGGGNYEVALTATPTEIAGARIWPLLNGDVIVADANLDFVYDVGITSLVGIDDFIIWSQDNQSTNHPVVALRVDGYVEDFISETALSISDLSHYDNAVITQTITQTGWYLVTTFISTPGYYYDSTGILRWFNVGYAQILVYLTAGYQFSYLDPNVVISLEAYGVWQRWNLFGTVSDADYGVAVAEILVILKDILKSDVGLPELRGPWPNPDDWRAPSNITIEQIRMICELLGDICPDVVEDGLSTEEMIRECYSEIILAGRPAKLIDPESYRMPKVNHSPSQDFAVTSSQLSSNQGSTDTARRSFWQSRLDNSRDPLGPLALDVVDDEFLLGCLANKRYLRYAEKFSVSDSLTSVGVQVMQRHVVSTDVEIQNVGPFVPGKLGARQIADYHHLVFNLLGLPNKTFGGTPFIGHRNEAIGTQVSFCPSCDNDN